jgi:hypothetical protein
VAIEQASESVSEICLSSFCVIKVFRALYFLTQRRNLLVEPGDLAFRYRFSMAISAVELREIPGVDARADPSFCDPCVDLSVDQPLTSVGGVNRPQWTQH